MSFSRFQLFQVLATSLLLHVGRVVHGEDLDAVLARVAGKVGDVDTLSTFQLEVSGDIFANFEAETPEDVAPASSYQGQVSVDLLQDFYRVDMTLTPLFEAFQFFPVTDTSRVIQGNVGTLDNPWNFFPNGALSSVSVASLKRNQQLLNPHIWLRNAISSSAVSYQGLSSDGQQDVLLLSNNPVSDVLLYVDSTGTITHLSATESNPLVRDTPVELRYSDWTLESNGIQFPAKVEMFTLASATRIWTEERTSVQVNLNLAQNHFDLAVEDATSLVADEDMYEYGMQIQHCAETFFHMGFAWIYDVPYADPVELTNDVFLVSGGFSHSNAMLLLTDNGAIVVEAASNEILGARLVDRVQQVAGAATTVTHLIQSHHHMDHSSGARTVVGETGADLVVGHGVKEFWESVLEAQSTIRPDVLSGNPTTAQVVEVPELGSLVLQDSDNGRIVVHHTNLDPHAEDAVIVQVDNGGETFLFMSDLYNAGFGMTVVVGGPQGLFAALMEIGIIDCACQSMSGEPIRIVPGHGIPTLLPDAIAELDSLGVGTGCQPASCTAQTTEDVLAALAGGVGDVATLATFQLNGVSGETFANYEGKSPDMVTDASTYEGVFSFDLSKDYYRIDMELTPLFEVFEFFSQAQTSRVIQGEIGTLDNPWLFIANGTLPTNSVSSLKRNQQLFNPHILLRDALSAEPPSVSYNGMTSNGESILVLSNMVSDISLYVQEDGLISKLATMESNPLSRDTPIEITYSDWTLESNGIKFPATVHFYTLESKTLVWSEERTTVDVNLEFATEYFDFPTGADTTAEVDAAMYEYGMQTQHATQAFFQMGFSWSYDAPYGDPAELAEGVYMLPSGVSNSLVVVSEEGAIVVEAAGNENLGVRLLDRVREITGSETPVITHVVQSHHHMDHSSGIRTVVGSSGAALVVGYGVKGFWESTLSAPSEIRPDVISEGDISSDVVEVPDLGALTLRDSDTLEVVVHHTDLDPHASDAVIVEVQTNGEIFLFMSDLYNAGFGLTVVVGGPEGLFGALMASDIVDCACESVSGLPITIVPGHGVATPLPDAISELNSLNTATGCQPAGCASPGPTSAPTSDSGDAASSHIPGKILVALSAGAVAAVAYMLN